MMNMKPLLIFSLWIMGSSVLAAAKNPSDIVVPIPQSEIVYPESLSTPPPPVSNYFFQLQVSSWAPNQLIQPSYLPNTTDFKSISPQFSLLMGSPLSEGESVRWTTLFGVSYVEMQRSGTLGYDANAFTVSQNLNLYQFQLGAEATFKKIFKDQLHPLIGLTLNPTWSQAPASEFNDGISQVDWLVRMTAGLSWSFPKFAASIGLVDTSLLLGAEATKNISAEDYSGSGLWIATRVNWH